MMQRAASATPEKWTVGDDGIGIASPEATVHLRWSSIGGYAETKRLILLRLPQGFFPVPRRSLTADQERDFRRFLAAKAATE
jgi:hypothetical protein